MARWIARLAVMSMVLVVAPVGAAVAAGTVAVAPPVAAAAPAPPATDTVGSVVDNEFIPDGRDLSDCVSALPQPDCGSENRGGWRQNAVLVVIALGLAFIGWQIVRGIRRNRSDLDASPASSEPAEPSPR